MPVFRSAIRVAIVGSLGGIIRDDVPCFEQLMPFSEGVNCVFLPVVGDDKFSWKPQSVGYLMVVQGFRYSV